MEHNQTTIELKTRTGIFGAENSREEKWILRLLMALLVCAVTAGVLHTIGQVIFIAHMCA